MAKEHSTEPQRHRETPAEPLGTAAPSTRRALPVRHAPLPSWAFGHIPSGPGTRSRFGSCTRSMKPRPCTGRGYLGWRDSPALRVRRKASLERSPGPGGMLDDRDQVSRRGARGLLGGGDCSGINATQGMRNPAEVELREGSSSASSEATPPPSPPPPRLLFLLPRGLIPVYYTVIQGSV